MKHYEDYLIEDFVQDESFQQWIFQSNDRAESFWTSWLCLHPEKLDDIEQARQIVLSLGLPVSLLEEGRLSRMKRAVWNQIAEKDAINSHKRKLWRYAVSACFIIMIGTVGFWWYHQHTYTQYTTDYGEKKILTLPDNSQVTLKANSTIRYPRHWEYNANREVWLTGEAFFQVQEVAIINADQPKRQYTKFTVHTINQVDVAVLGTEFNVNTRTTETEVALKSGSVRLEVNINRPQTIILSPGELVSIQHGPGVISKKQVELPSPKRWQENMLFFDEITLGEIAVKLRYSFGVEIHFENTAIANYRFKGFLPDDDLDILLEAFSKLYNLEIETQERGQIIFRDQQP